MSRSGERLHDVRRRPTFSVDRAAIDYLPRIGPAAWAVYCYLISTVADGDTVWPDSLTVASACGISTYNAEISIATLLDTGMIIRHEWTSGMDSLASFAIVPVVAGQGDELHTPEIDREPSAPGILNHDQSTGEARWKAETEERNQTRALFSRLLEALDVEPGDLSDAARTTATEASRLARAAGASPEDVDDMIGRIRDVQPDLVDDAEKMLQYWSDLFAEMSQNTDGEPSHDRA